MAETAPTPTPTPTPAPSAWYQGIDTGIIEKWQGKGLGPFLADPKEAMTKLWDQYAHLESHMGVPADRIIKLPKDAADQAGWQQTWQRLGVPKDAKDYDFSSVKFSDGTDLEAGFIDGMRAALHKANVAKETAPEVIKAVIKYLDDADKAEADVRTSTLGRQKDALKQSWGPKHDENLLAAKQGARRLGVDAETVAQLEGLMGYDKVMEMFRKIGAGTTEDTFVGGGNMANPATQLGAKARLDELQQDSAWVKRLFAGDVQARKEYETLTEQIAGVTSAAA